jgi:hypothetical protein
MGYTLARDVHACEADGLVYFLDAGRDRYCQAGASASRALLTPDGFNQARNSTFDALVAAGLLTFQPGTADPLALCRHRSPGRDLHAQLPRRPPVRMNDVLAVAALAAAASLRLRFQGFARALDWARRQAPACRERHISVDDLAAEIARYQCARSLLPASPRCLLDSMMLKAWTAARGFRTQLVIGIRSIPFAAHCWVEHDGIVLNGSQDGVANFTPICVL